MPTVTASYVISIRRADTSVEHKKSAQITLDDNKEDGRILAVGTSEEELTFSADVVGGCGYLYLENLDPTNYIEVGFETTVYVIRLRPAQAAMVPIQPTQASIFARSNTAACDLKFNLFRQQA